MLNEYWLFLLCLLGVVGELVLGREDWIKVAS